MMVKNWDKFQHYKTRKPAWIKFHRDILDDREILMLPADDYRFLTLCWLLASEAENLDGMLPPMEDLVFRLRMSESEIKTRLSNLKNWIVDTCYQPASNALAIDDSAALALEEKRREETETETEKNIVVSEVFKKSDHSEHQKPIEEREKPERRNLKPIADEITAEWNAMTELAKSCGYDIPKIHDFGQERTKHLGERLKSEFWRENWKAAIELIPRTPFLRGQNPRQWTANITWFLRPEAVPKTLEHAFGEPVPVLEKLEEIF